MRSVSRADWEIAAAIMFCFSFFFNAVVGIQENTRVLSVDWTPTGGLATHAAAQRDWPIRIVHCTPMRDPRAQAISQREYTFSSKHFIFIN